jgi:hypothetical protein
MKISASTISILVGAFLLPLLGGYLPLESALPPATENHFFEVLRGQWVPHTAHFFLSLLFVIPLLSLILRRKLVHVIRTPTAVWMGAFFGLLLFSALASSFRVTSLIWFVEWCLMGLCFFAITTQLGRKQSRWMCLSLFAGITVNALLGIKEFGDMRAYDPTYRIFSGFISPNQTAASYIGGICLGLGLLPSTQRLTKLGIGLGTILQILALYLTQSKGAILCLPVGIVVLVIGWAVQRRVSSKAWIPALVVPLVFGGIIVYGSQKSTEALATSGKGGTVGLAARIESTEATMQSAGFRKLLWISTIKLAQERPYGWGIGSFQYVSGRPGIVTQTGLAHQTPLQLAAEATVLAPIAFLGLVISILFTALRGFKSQDETGIAIQLGSLAALGSLLAHNLIDSDMYIFGLGGMVFVLLGCLTTSAADAQSIELVFKTPRFGLASGLIALLMLGSLTAATNLTHARSVYAASSTHNPCASSPLKLLGDGYCLSQIATTRNELLQAAGLHPVPKALRRLAARAMASNDPNLALALLKRADGLDTHNVFTLSQILALSQQLGDEALAKLTAERLVALESTTVMTVRSLPELVPTQTFVARTFLASHESNPERRIELLKPAIVGYVKYAKTTVPMVLRSVGKSSETIAGEGRSSIEQNLNAGKRALQDLRDAFRAANREPDVDFLGAESAFDSGLADLKK